MKCNLYRRTQDGLRTDHFTPLSGVGMQSNEAISATPIPMTNGTGGEDTSRPSPVMVPNPTNPLAATNATSTSPTVSSSGSNSLPTPTGAPSTVLTPGLPAPSAPYLTITNPAMTAAVLSQQPLIIPTGAQFLTIPVSLATLPGSNQIPVFATSTGQLVLANLASVPTPGSNYNASNHGANSTSPFSVTPSPFVTQAGQLSRPPAGIPGMPGISIHSGSQSGLATSALSVTSASGLSDGHEVDIDRDEVKAECANSEEVEEEVEDEEEDEEGAHSSSPASISENKICNILNDTGSGDEGLSSEDHIALVTRRAAVGNDNGGKVVVDGIDLEEIREFARQFKIRRLSLGLTQSQVGQALTAAEGPAYSQSAICRFEKLDITPKSAQKIKPVLEKWMREAEQRYQEGLRETGTSNLASDLTKKRKRRTSFTPQALDVLNAHFDKNTHPSGAEMTALAEQLKYDREVVRVWFCNKRQALKNTIKRLKTDRQFQQTAVTAASTLPLSRQHPLSSPLPPPTPVSQQLQQQTKQQPPLPSPLSQPHQQQQQLQQQQLHHRLQQQRQPLPQLQLQLPTPSSLANRVLSQSGGGLCNIPLDELKAKLVKLEPPSSLPCNLKAMDPAGLASIISSNQHLNHEPDSSIASEACNITPKVEADPV